MRIPNTSFEEQRSIADRLDSLASAEQVALSAIERQIVVLIERRRALVTAAVTGQMRIPGVAA
jgi:type I restriction enzyme S subunit